MSRPERRGREAERRTPAPVFAALGDSTRLALVSTLSRGRPCSITELTRNTRLTRQAITKHLRVLEHAGIVRSSRRGRESRFRYNPLTIAAVRSYLDRVSLQWDQALSRLQALVERDPS